MKTKSKGTYVSTYIKGKGRFYAWGPTKEAAQSELIAGLVDLLSQATKHAQYAELQLHKTRHDVDQAIQNNY